MRLLCLGAGLALAACNSFPVLANPRLQVSPYLAVHELRGDIGMQNDPGTGPQDNRQQALRTFGFDKHEEDIGVRGHIGDGFQGLSLDYYLLDQGTTRAGFLDDDFGALPVGSEVNMEARMDELRLGWIQQVAATKFDWHDQPVEVRFGAGAVLAHRSLDMHMRTTDGMLRQNVQADDSGVVYPAVQLRAEWNHAQLDVGLAISPDLNLGGDFQGTMYDFEARIGYTVPYQDVMLFAGWRYSTLPIEGTEGGLHYDGDLVLDGFQFGLQVSF